MARCLVCLAIISNLCVLLTKENNGLLTTIVVPILGFFVCFLLNCQMIITLTMKISYQFFKMFVMFCHCYQANILAKNCISEFKNKKKQPYLVLITGSCVHLIFLVSHVPKTAGNMIESRHCQW